MKTSKRTPPAKGRRKVAKGRRKVAKDRRKVTKTSSIIPGNDIFDIIDYHFTRKAAYDKGRDDGIKWVQETFGPAARKILRDIDDIRQEKASVEEQLEKTKMRLEILDLYRKLYNLQRDSPEI